MNKAATEEYMRSADDKMLYFIHAARQKRIHPALLTLKQLRRIYQTFRTTTHIEELIKKLKTTKFFVS